MVDRIRCPTVSYLAFHTNYLFLVYFNYLFKFTRYLIYCRQKDIISYGGSHCLQTHRRGARAYKKFLSDPFILYTFIYIVYFMYIHLFAYITSYATKYMCKKY